MLTTLPPPQLQWSSSAYGFDCWSQSYYLPIGIPRDHPRKSPFKFTMYSIWEWWHSVHMIISCLLWYLIFNFMNMNDQLFCNFFHLTIISLGGANVKFVYKMSLGRYSWTPYLSDNILRPLTVWAARYVVCSFPCSYPAWHCSKFHLMWAVVTQTA